ncbi:MAG TPA: hypothetical protein VKU80_13630, partial [Planctomycetota bacterium]|nr:hypothetical protein [Planctomycetota bacterium]
MMGRRSGFLGAIVAVAVLFAGAAAAEAQSVSMSSNASYHQGDLPSPVPSVTVTCAAGYWNSSNHIRLIIPNGLNMTWDPSMTSGSTLTVTGTAQSLGHIAANPTFSFANSNKTIIITV